MMYAGWIHAFFMITTFSNLSPPPLPFFFFSLSLFETNWRSSVLRATCQTYHLELAQSLGFGLCVRYRSLFPVIILLWSFPGSETWRGARLGSFRRRVRLGQRISHLFLIAIRLLSCAVLSFFFFFGPFFPFLFFHFLFGEADLQILSCDVSVRNT